MKILKYLIVIYIIASPLWGVSFLEERNSVYNEMPKVLTEKDLNLYKKVYNFQKQGYFKLAKRSMEDIKDPILKGYMYYLLYMSKGYISTFAELQKWMHNYYDLPIANKIYKLALRKRGKNSKSKIKKYKNYPTYIKELYKSDDSFFTLQYEGSFTVKSSKFHLKKSSTTRKLQSYANKGKTLSMKRILSAKNIRKQLGNYTYGYYSFVLSKLYFNDGYYKYSINWGKEALKYNKYIPDNYFNLGLSYYKLKNYDRSSYYFKQLADNPTYYSSDIISKAAYWFAKVSYKQGNINNYYDYLLQTAKYKYNFYGLIAALEAGVPLNHYEKNKLIDYYKAYKVDLKYLLTIPNGRRIYALIQMGLNHWAEQELIAYLSTVKELSAKAMASITYLSEKIPLPSLGVKLAGDFGKYYGLARLAYPVLLLDDLQEGYVVDPALVLAIIKRESMFMSTAKSSSGAIGLMQLMPSTANIILKKYNINKSNYDISTLLNFPENNIEIGQHYIKQLLANTYHKGNLVYVLASYNAGDNNLKEWVNQKHREANNDPLFFIESIPFRETRNYVKSVLADYWIYQSILNIPSRGLLQVVNGGYPIYYHKEFNNISK